MDENEGVWIFSEVYDLALELLGKGRELADQLETELVAILIGDDAEAKGEELVKYGADAVYVVSDPALKHFEHESYLGILYSLVEKYHPEILLVGSTRNGKPLAAKLATRLNTGCVPDCSKLSVDGDRMLIGERITYGGKATAKVTFTSKPQIATIPMRAFEKPELQSREGQLVKLDVKIEEPKTEVIERRPLETSGVKIEEAEIIICCGRGLENKEDQTLLTDFAQTFGGQVGCSRPLAEDRKWFSEWIGLSGHKVKPKLYIACGISGVIQHVAGIRDAKVIVAINKDPEAPIFEVADYGVVGDLYEVLPALKEALAKRLG